ncbi:MAG: hypothetical protein WAM28_00345 [Chlamydiales bacterium]
MSILLFSTSMAASFFCLYKYRAKEEQTIRAIVQSTPNFNELNTVYLTELMGLSIDRPSLINQFDLKEAGRRLLASSIIKKAALKKIKPDLLYVEYAIRKPFFYSADWSHTAVDEEGVFFPFTPFYPPEYKTEIYLGALAPPIPWGSSMRKELLAIVKELFDLFQSRPIKQIDISQVEEESSGKRQIVIVLEIEGKMRILRLTPKNYAQELANYFILEATCPLKNVVVDLRIPEVAYIQDIRT